MSLLQEAGRQPTVLPGSKQAFGFTPSQKPLHAVPSPGHAAREPCGAPWIGRQVPMLPPSSHASQPPAQAWLQQTPSTQLPERQELARVQGVPSVSFGKQTLLLQ